MVDLSIWESPLSIILATANILLIYILAKYGGRKITALLESKSLSAILLSVTAVLMAIEGSWKLQLYHTWAFAGLILVSIIALGLTTINSINKHNPAFSMSHAGIFIILFGGFWGAADYVEADMIVNRDFPNHIAVTQKGESVPLPFEVKLNDFKTDYYGDGVNPKQFTSTLDVDGKTMQASVNHPCRYKGYRIYQAGYDKEQNQYSVLKIVRDPWLNLVFAGMAILLISAIMELRKTWQSKAVLPLIIVLAAVFSILSVARINFGTLMPALRSLWFIPHLILYMLAYSVLSAALFCGITGLFSNRIKRDLPRKLLATSSSLLLMGMIIGAIWAKSAWGNYWTWDAKENWAAATWLLTLVGTHIPSGKKNSVLAIFTVLSFAAMQITWYGVNYLPAARHSMHTYNK